MTHSRTHRNVRKHSFARCCRENENGYFLNNECLTASTRGTCTRTRARTHTHTTVSTKWIIVPVHTHTRTQTHEHIGTHTHARERPKGNRIGRVGCGSLIFGQVAAAADAALSPCTGYARTRTHFALFISATTISLFLSLSLDTIRMICTCIQYHCVR